MKYLFVISLYLWIQGAVTQGNTNIVYGLTYQLFQLVLHSSIDITILDELHKKMYYEMKQKIHFYWAN